MTSSMTSKYTVLAVFPANPEEVCASSQCHLNVIAAQQCIIIAIQWHSIHKSSAQHIKVHNKCAMAAMRS